MEETLLVQFIRSRKFGKKTRRVMLSYHYQTGDFSRWSFFCFVLPTQEESCVLYEITAELLRTVSMKVTEFFPLVGSFVFVIPTQEESCVLHAMNAALFMDSNN